MASRSAALVAALLAWLSCVSRAFPVYVAANGTTVVRAAFGSNVVLSTSNGGALGRALRVLTVDDGMLTVRRRASLTSPASGASC